jgi:hypothetical protein
MSSKLQSVDPTLLSTITGAGSSSADVQVGVQVDKKFNVGVSGSTSQTDYAKCIDTVSKLKDVKPADLTAACGLPPAN